MQNIVHDSARRMKNMMQTTFDQASPIERVSLIRNRLIEQGHNSLPDEWLVWLLTTARSSIEGQGDLRDASHLHANLKGRRIGDRFVMSEKEYMITDIGTRTICAVHLDERVKADPSWLNGPTYALTEIVIDEDDFPAII